MSAYLLILVVASVLQVALLIAQQALALFLVSASFDEVNPKPADENPLFVNNDSTGHSIILIFKMFIENNNEIIKQFHR